MMDDEQDRRSWGDFIAFLRWLLGIDTQAELSRRSGIPRSEINRYEQGRQKPQPATFQQMTERLGVPGRLIGFLRWCHRLIRRAHTHARTLEEAPASEPRIPEETRGAVWDVVERALALARAEHAVLRGMAVSPSPRRTEQLFEELLSHPEAGQHLLIRASQAYRDPLLCMRLCKASEELAPHDPSRAMQLAELALFVARHVGLEEPGSDAFRTRLEGWCWGFIGNAQRVIGSDLPAAERTWSRVWSLWKEGEDPAGLLSEAYLLDMEASLRRDQRLFPKALKLHEKALVLARPEEVGVILLNQAFTLKESGDPEGALLSLERAAHAINPEREPRLRWVLRFNQSASLCVLGRAGEATTLLPEVRQLADRLGNEIDRIRTSWLEANCLAGLGQKEEALVKLEQVRHEFEARNLPFDYALASLDVALLYREQGRFPEIKRLAGEMLEIFSAQQVHREALGAMILFQEAADNEQVTEELVRRLQDFLGRSSRQPGLKFKWRPGTS